MGFYYRKRVPVGKRKRTWINVSKSGLSVSHRRGNTTVNTRGRFWVKLGKGFGYRGKI
jgi:hypothetical protein